MKNIKMAVSSFFIGLMSIGASGQSDSIVEPKEPIYKCKIQSLTGAKVNLENYKGKKILFVNVASKCGFTPQYAELQELSEKYKDKLVMYGLDVGQFTHLGDTEDALSLLLELDINYTAGYTDDAEVVRDYKLLTMPSTYFITAEGEIAKVYRGVIPEETLEQILEGLVDGS